MLFNKVYVIACPYKIQPYLVKIGAEVHMLLCEFLQLGYLQNVVYVILDANYVVACIKQNLLNPFGFVAHFNVFFYEFY